MSKGPIYEKLNLKKLLRLWLRVKLQEAIDINPNAILVLPFDSDGTLFPHTWSEGPKFLAENAQYSNFQVFAALQDVIREDELSNKVETPIVSNQWSSVDAARSAGYQTKVGLEDVYSSQFPDLPLIGREKTHGNVRPGATKGSALAEHLGRRAKDAVICYVDDDKNDTYEHEFPRRVIPSMYGTRIQRKGKALTKEDRAGSCMTTWQASAEDELDSRKALGAAQSGGSYGFCPESIALNLIQTGHGHEISPEIMASFGCRDLHALANKATKAMGVPDLDRSFINASITKPANTGKTGTSKKQKAPPAVDRGAAKAEVRAAMKAKEDTLGLKTRTTVIDDSDDEELLTPIKELKEAIKTAVSSNNPNPAITAKNHAESVLKALKDRPGVKIAGQSFNNEGKALDLYEVAAKAGNLELLQELRTRGVEQKQNKYPAKDAVAASLAEYRAKTDEASILRSKKAGKIRNFFTKKNEKIENQASAIEQAALGQLISILDGLVKSGVYNFTDIKQLEVGLNDAPLQALRVAVMKDRAQNSVKEAWAPLKAKGRAADSVDISDSDVARPADYYDKKQDNAAAHMKADSSPSKTTKNTGRGPDKEDWVLPHEKKRQARKVILPGMGGTSRTDHYSSQSSLDQSSDADDIPTLDPKKSNIEFAKQFVQAMQGYGIGAQKMKGAHHLFYVLNNNFSGVKGDVIVVKVRYEENSKGEILPNGEVQVATNPNHDEAGDVIKSPKSDRFKKGADYQDLAKATPSIKQAFEDWTKIEYQNLETQKTKQVAATSPRAWGDTSLPGAVGTPPSPTTHATSYRAGNDGASVSVDRSGKNKASDATTKRGGGGSFRI